MSKDEIFNPENLEVAAEQLARAQNMSTAMCAFLSEDIPPELSLADAKKLFEDKLIDYGTGLIEMFLANWEQVKANKAKLSGRKVLHLPGGEEHLVDETTTEGTPPTDT